VRITKRTMWRTHRDTSARSWAAIPTWLADPLYLPAMQNSSRTLVDPVYSVEIRERNGTPTGAIVTFALDSENRQVLNSCYLTESTAYRRRPEAKQSVLTAVIGHC
jgi:hypothetical protein